MSISAAAFANAAVSIVRVVDERAGDRRAKTRLKKASINFINHPHPPPAFRESILDFLRTRAFVKFLCEICPRLWRALSRAARGQAPVKMTLDARVNNATITQR